MTLISGLNILLGSETFASYSWWIIIAVVISVIVEIAISAIIALIVEKMPNRFFPPTKKLYTVSKKEQKFYEKLGIKSWKDKVWELGGLGGFRKNKIKDSTNSEYLYQFMIESNKGMTSHIINLFAGFLVIFVLPLKYALRIGVPVACIGLLLNFLPILILRYNLPKLDIAYRRAKRLEERAETKDNENHD